jgi:hypothetical protein
MDDIPFWAQIFSFWTTVLLLSRGGTARARCNGFFFNIHNCVLHPPERSWRPPIGLFCQEPTTVYRHQGHLPVDRQQALIILRPFQESVTSLPYSPGSVLSYFTSRQASSEAGFHCSSSKTVDTTNLSSPTGSVVHAASDLPPLFHLGLAQEHSRFGSHHSLTDAHPLAKSFWSWCQDKNTDSEPPTKPYVFLRNRP